MSSQPLNVVLCWHMHQPSYWVDGRYAQPWVYLHAIKDYTDMAAHIETVPKARAVFNFVPVLLDQIEHYRTLIHAFLGSGSAIPDALLDALARAQLPQEPLRRADLIKQCQHVNERHVLGRFPAFARLVALARHAGVDAGRLFSDAYLADLLVWFHLSWLGEHTRRDDARVRQLLVTQSGYTVAERRLLVTIIGEMLDSLLARYRRLESDRRIELAVSPQAHPILPLLLDLESAREGLPHSLLPSNTRYPGGEARARWHLQEARRSFAQHFGSAPRGCWPSEGAISTATLGLIAAAGFSWTASGGGVLTNSLAASQLTVTCAHRPFMVNDVACFFRDDGLSDLIGFTYKDWHADDAVANLIGHLETIGRHCDRPDAIVSIILDGENAWESYPENGYAFLQALYGSLAEHPALRLTTFSDYLDANPRASLELKSVVAGSWVYGTLSTWIGNPDKNKAWELLQAAKRLFDDRRPSLPNVDECEALLAICEGSDWFWWLGDDNGAETVARFESLFRAHLKAFYRAMGEPPPATLDVPLSRGSDHAAAHVMRSSSGQ